MKWKKNENSLFQGVLKEHKALTKSATTIKTSF